MVLEQVAIKR